MKRLVLTTTGTVAGLAALLSFKIQTHPLTTTGALPTAGTATNVGSGSSGDSGNTGRSGSSKSTSNGTGSAASSSKSSAGPAAPKTYVGQAITTRYGVVQVKATVAGSRITGVAFVQLTAFDGHSAQINSYAGPQLLQETLKQQTAQVDTISGASYTSEGYRQSLQSALDEAGLK